MCEGTAAVSVKLPSNSVALAYALDSPVWKGPPKIAKPMDGLSASATVTEIAATRSQRM